jgi:hypothetical protein
MLAKVNYLAQCNSTHLTSPPPPSFQENTYREHVCTITRWPLVLKAMNEEKILIAYLGKYGTLFCIHI